MKYPVVLAVLAAVLFCLIAGLRSAAAKSRPLGFGLRLRPCTLIAAPELREFFPPPELRMQVDRRHRFPSQSASLAASVGQAGQSNDLLFGVLALKQSSKGRATWGIDELEAARWRWLPSSTSDVRRAQRDYSFAGMVPTACLAAGALTLGLQSGVFGTVKIAAKTWRAGGVLGIQAKF